jgi:hypothetical protein
LARVVHLNDPQLLYLLNGAEQQQAEERIARYRQGLPTGLNLTENIHLLSALFLTKSTTSSDLAALNRDLDSALFTQLFAGSSNENSFHEYLSLSHHFSVLCAFE